MSKDDILRLDLNAILKQRAPKYYKFIPRFLIRKLERTICQDQLNELLEVNHGKRDAEFCRGVLNHLNVTVDSNNNENLPNVDDRRVLFISNHPLGALDGMALIDFVERHYSGHVGFIVNDLLMALEPLHGTFIPINKHGRQSRKSLAAIDNAFAGNDPLIIFPAGLCSRRGKKGVIKDLEWQKMFVKKAVEYKRDIIPLFFSGENSSFFYKFAKFRTRIGLKFNIEMVYLPKEVFRSKGKHFDIYVGKPISWQSLNADNARDEAARLKEVVYALKPTQDLPK